MPIIDVVIVAPLEDVHGQAVAQAVGQRAEVAVMSCETLLTAGVSWSLRDGLSLTTRECVATINRDTSVWWRRSGWPKVSGFDATEARFVTEESVAMLHGLLAAAAGPLWVDHPHLADRAARKPWQLAVAGQLGVTTPSTLVTNQLVTASRFIEGQPAIAKAISSGFGIAPYADLVEADDLATIAVLPTLLQAYAKSDGDLRVVTVGGTAFVWRRPRLADDAVDWRRSDPHGVGFTACEDEQQVGQLAIRIADALDLQFSVQDWLAGPDGPVFLEVNPRGNWLFLNEADQLIPTALADLLLAK